jgi:hypothetical protein
MAEWSIEHAWKAILAMLAEEHGNIASRSQFNKLRAADLR